MREQPMPRTITGEFATRREAELAVEHLVQEHGIDRAAVQIAAVGEENSAGVVPSGADRDARTGDPEASATHGRIRVSATVDDALAGPAEQALRQARGA
jgi:hypothetical protein